MSEKGDARKLDDLGDGFGDGMKPLRALDLSSIKSLDDLLEEMANTAFGARGLGGAFRVLVSMIKDPDCFIVGSFSGAMTMAKMGLVLCEMMDRGFLDAVVATGALVMHGLVENAGSAHFRHDPKWRDEELYKRGYNRVYDTIEAERSLYGISLTLDKIWEDVDHQSPCSSSGLLAKVGQHLSGSNAGRGILRSAWETSLRSVSGPGRLHQKNPGGQTHRNLHHRRGRSEKLEPAGGAICGGALPQVWRGQRVEPVQICRKNLPRAGALGWTLRMHLLRRSLLGQVRAHRRGRTMGGGVVRRHHRLAPADKSTDRAFR
jgi:hypothetical protein